MSYCKVCGKPLPAKHHTYCSRACQSLDRQHKRICAVCGKKFKAAPTDNSVCCSKECSAKHKEQLHKAGVYDYAVQKWLDSKSKFFAEHSGPEHVNAKHWVIQAPDGQIYECQNLMYFIKNNPELFDGTSKQAFDGFAKIKASLQGKRKFPSYSWKGWRLIDYD